VMLARFIKILSSWKTTAVLVIGFVAVYLRYTFGEKPYEDWLNFIFKSLPGLAMYIALIANLLAMSIRAAAAKLGSESIVPELIKSMDAWVEMPLWSTTPLEDVSEVAKAAGFGMEVEGATAAWRRGRYSFVPGTLFRLGIVVFMIAALMSAHLRVSARGILYEGGEKELTGKVFKLESLNPNLPETFLQVGEKSTFNLKGVSAVVSLMGHKYTVTPGLPKKAQDRYLRITNLGYTQPISGKTGSAVFDWDVFLDVLPPGKIDAKTILSDVDSLSFSLAPSKTIEKGLVTGRLYNIENPMYSLSIIDSATGKHSESAIASPGEETKVGGVDITLGDRSVYIQMQAVKDPALKWLYFGVVLMLEGLALLIGRFFWYERKLYAFRTYEAVLVGYSEEFYKKWGILRFENLRESLTAYARSRM